MLMLILSQLRMIMRPNQEDTMLEVETTILSKTICLCSKALLKSATTVIPTPLDSTKKEALHMSTFKLNTTICPTITAHCQIGLDLPKGEDPCPHPRLAVAALIKEVT